MTQPNEGTQEAIIEARGISAARSTMPANYMRSSFAVPDDVHQALPGIVRGLGLRSVAALLTMLARNPTETTAALGGMAAKFNENLSKATGAKGARKQLADRLKTMAPEDVERLLKLADQAPAAGESAAS